MPFQLIESVVRDHPYHSLYIVLALAHATKDDDPAFLSGNQGRRGSKLQKSGSSIKREEVNILEL